MDAISKHKGWELVKKIASQATTLEGPNGVMPSPMVTAWERMLGTELKVHLTAASASWDGGRSTGGKRSVGLYPHLQIIPLLSRIQNIGHEQAFALLISGETPCVLVGVRGRSSSVFYRERPLMTSRQNFDRV